MTKVQWNASLDVDDKVSNIGWRLCGDASCFTWHQDLMCSNDREVGIWTNKVVLVGS
jgi:hypothetical protein